MDGFAYSYPVYTIQPVVNLVIGNRLCRVNGSSHAVYTEFTVFLFLTISAIFCIGKNRMTVVTTDPITKTEFVKCCLKNV